MLKALTAFRIFLVMATAIFMAYHTQIFISRIEPNFFFSWAASLIIEGFLVSLALSRTVISRVLLIPLFLISVIAASASFIVQNENLLDGFLKNRRVIEQIKTDLSETKNTYQYGQKYTTKTLQRERQLQDDLRSILKDQNGDITLVNSLIFLILVLVVQSVSIYTAASLKNGNFQKPETKNGKVSGPETENFRKISSETSTENTETLETEGQKTEVFSPENGKVSGEISEVSETQKHGNFETENRKLTEEDKKLIVTGLRKRKSEGGRLEDLAEAVGVSKSTLSKVLQYPSYHVTEEIFKKIASKL